MAPLTLLGLRWAFPPQRILSVEKYNPSQTNGLKVGLSSSANVLRQKYGLSYPNGLKWTRTTDLTLIRRAL